MAMMPSSSRSGPYSPSRIMAPALRLAGRVVAALGLIGVVTFFAFHVVAVNEITAGFLYLVAILLIATAGGLVESTIASILAKFCFNYFFLPPIGTLTVFHPPNLVPLFSFFFTSPTARPLSHPGQHP